MTRKSLMWYAIVGVFVLGPVGLRMSNWPKPQQTAPVDPNQAALGKVLFTHEWTINDPLSPDGDGLGPVFNANSCAACHHQGGVGGSGGLEHNVTTFIAQPNGQGEVRQGVVHASAIDPGLQETLNDIDASLPKIARPDLLSLLPDREKGLVPRQMKKEEAQQVKLDIPHGIHISQRNTPALFGAGLIDSIPDSAIIAEERSQKLRWAGAEGESAPVGRAFIHKDRKVGKFGWKAQSTSLISFVEAACASELGLSNPGQPQPNPLGSPNYRSRGKGTDLTTTQCQQMAAYIAILPQPKQQLPANARDAERVRNGHKLFSTTGCANCHVQSLASVQGIYSDLLLHKMGRDLEGVGGYNSPPQTPQSPDSSPDEWRTPPLWGVADSAPYLHDGRAATLEEAIRLHGGQARLSSQNFQRLDDSDRGDLIAFLKSLQAPR